MPPKDYYNRNKKEHTEELNFITFAKKGIVSGNGALLTIIFVQGTDTFGFPISRN